MEEKKSALGQPAVSADTHSRVPAEPLPSPDWRAAPDAFVHRHVGPRSQDWAPMLERCGFKSLDEMMDAVVPPSIRRPQPLQLPAAVSEWEGLQELRQIAAQNQVFRSFLGQGYYDCFTPPVLLRNVLENPGWYTQYTPYQAEIAQGRLELLLHFQTMICDLTGLAIANASLLDEGTAAAEAMTMCYGLKEAENRKVFFVSDQCHPQTIEVVKTRAWPLGLEVQVGDHRVFEFSAQVFGALVQYPATDGVVFDYEPFVRQAHEAGAQVVVAADPLSLVLLRPPGEFGADVAVGSTQRFGVPMGFGGPHAAYLATREEFKRRLPGRLVGLSKDAQGRPAFRLALQTREQHIRREKATSNICTAQVLLANLAVLYAMYHGPHGLRRIARRVLGLTRTLAAGLQRLGCQVGTATSFDTLRVKLNGPSATEVQQQAEAHQFNLRILDHHTIGLSLDETTTEAEVAVLWRIFNHDQPPGFTFAQLAQDINLDLPAPLARTHSVLTQWPFNRYHSETEMLRYLRRLEARDLSLTTSMIPLGSCTMKLNAAVEMLPISWPEFSRLHPFAPATQTQGYQAIFYQLEQWLAEITGFAGVSLQPNAGSQGEYSGLLVIRKYHESRGQPHRDICLIPASAHGTNPASAALAGLKVVAVACDRDGNVDLADLRAKAEAHRQDLAALMVTYPSTHGVFETGIKEICQIVHENGGQVYLDGANMNAQVGLCRPGDFGADVCHLNLHKTFSIPHGGGGPGIGPICVASHLVPFLPGHSVVAQPNRQALSAVASAPWGSASILPISWTYIRLMGPEGLLRATQVAILNANYVAKRMQACFPVLYRGRGNLVAHECILDLRAFKNTTVEDVAKRLMDFGFHAPTISWPVAGTMMVEPTESESKAELDRFCDALTAIHGEMVAVESGQMDRQNNPLKNAPHTADLLAGERWDRPYSRAQAVYPAPWLRDYKFWPAVGRIDNVYGDRNPICTCVGMEAIDS